jgi:hypothetical protein
MTTNQKLRADVAHWKDAFSRAVAERNKLENELEAAERQYRACAEASFLVVLSLVMFIVISDLVW